MLSTLVTGLSEGVSYKWRLRVVTDSPYFPRGPWFFHPNKNYFQADILIGMPTLIPLDLPVNIGPRKDGQERIKLFSLQSIYPNPFKPETTICFSLNEPLHITLAIYNVQGQRVKILVHGEKEAGPHLESWDGRNEKGVDVGSGIYFVRFEGGKWKQTKKVVRIQ